MILGTTAEQAPFCAKLCRDLGCIVISVDYALGPYEQFPKANHDCEDIVYAVLDAKRPGYRELRKGIADQLAKHKRAALDIDTTHVAISGFSSGGNLALELVLDIKPPTLPEAWPSPFPVAHAGTIPVLLYYPSLDARLLPNERPYPEGMEPKVQKGIVKKLDLETHLMPTYLPRDQAAHPRASPGLVPISALHPKAEVSRRLFKFISHRQAILTSQNQISDPPDSALPLPARHTLDTIARLDRSRQGGQAGRSLEGRHGHGRASRVQRLSRCVAEGGAPKAEEGLVPAGGRFHQGKVADGWAPTDGCAQRGERESIIYCRHGWKMRLCTKICVSM